MATEIINESGDVLRVGEIDITLIHTPGHTPGSQCFLVDSKHTDQLQAYLESQFGALTICRGVFEHCGILREHDPASFEVFMHQRHYAARLKSIDTEAFDTENATLLAMPLNASEHSQYLSVLGGLSWMLQTRGDISIYVQALQRDRKSVV